MILAPRPDFPPADFVAFLAQRSGLSEEAAEDRLQSWLDEYQAGSSQRAGHRDSRRVSVSL
jgi:hypothetical protein